LQIEGDLDKRGVGIYDMSSGVGAHEVIIETPEHDRDIPDMPLAQVEKILRMYCRRETDLIKDSRFKYIMIFRNFGPAAGASLAHSHSQLIALPMVPKNVAEEMHGASEYLKFKDRCIFCDIIRQEQEEKERVIVESKSYLAFCPYVSRFPFEYWIIPREHKSHFRDTSGEGIRSLAQILKETLQRLKRIFPRVSYNFMLHSSPANGEISGRDAYHWHIECTPQLMRVAGFEWGTGFYSVPTPPELAAHFLRDAR
ncbi:MAG: galactose-1-phosphate uridylyltransferase, partial [Candidatus Omnitrophica bacterium]|nr:galactose-1-phosphate uridylyltransferase [Candidatus Omnitrophota bacterium]